MARAYLGSASILTEPLQQPAKTIALIYKDASKMERSSSLFCHYYSIVAEAELSIIIIESYHCLINQNCEFVLAVSNFFPIALGHITTVIINQCPVPEELDGVGNRVMVPFPETDDYICRIRRWRSVTVGLGVGVGTPLLLVEQPLKAIKSIIKIIDASNGLSLKRPRSRVKQ